MNYFEKKQWIRLAVCAVVLLAVSLFLTGVIGGKNLVYKMPDGTETKGALAEGGADYAWKSEQETDFSTIRVEMNAADGKITDCRITSEAKAGSVDFMNDAIREAWAKSIVENGTAENDVISGATIKFSADAVKKAVNELLPEMGIEVPAKDEPAPEAAPETPAEAPAAEDAPAQAGGQTVTKETPFSFIHVTLDIRDGKIADCQITSEAKEGSADFLNDAIRESWAKAIVENGTAETDVITGATITASSAAVIEAVKEITGK